MNDVEELHVDVPSKKHADHFSKMLNTRRQHVRGLISLVWPEVRRDLANPWVGWTVVVSLILSSSNPRNMGDVGSCEFGCNNLDHSQPTKKRNLHHRAPVRCVCVVSDARGLGWWVAAACSK